MVMIASKRACEILGISSESLRRLVLKGKLKKHKLQISAGPHAARYDEDDVLELREKMTRPANAAQLVTMPRPKRRRPTKSTRRELIDFG